MLDIFKEAEKARLVASKPIAREGKSSAGIIIRRSGKVIKDTVERKVVSYPSVKKKEKVDRSALDSSTVESFTDNAVRRKELGKYVYEQREQMIRVLVQGYSVKLESVAELSFNSLLEKFDDVKMEEAKKLELLKKSKKEYEERLGNFYNSFKLVSNVVSDINSEHTVLEEIEKDDDEVEEDGISFSESEEEREERWQVRRTVILEKQEEARYLKYACKNLTMEEIQSIENGTITKAVDTEAAKHQVKRERMVESFLARGFNPNEAEIRTKHWEASL